MIRNVLEPCKVFIPQCVSFPSLSSKFFSSSIVLFFLITVTHCCIQYLLKYLPVSVFDKHPWVVVIVLAEFQVRKNMPFELVFHGVTGQINQG